MRVSPPSVSTHARGFTTIELMVTVATLAVLAALAAPSFGPLIERWRVRQGMEELQATLYLARSEAIKRGGNVTIAKTANTDDCANATGGTQWGCGWKVYFDANKNGSQDACAPATASNECDLQSVNTPSRLQITVANSTGAISVDRWGMLSNGTTSGAAQAMDFLVVAQGKTASDASALRLCIAPGGRFVQLKGSQTCP